MYSNRKNTHLNSVFTENQHFFYGCQHFEFHLISYAKVVGVGLYHFEGISLKSRRQKYEWPEKKNKNKKTKLSATVSTRESWLKGSVHVVVRHPLWHIPQYSWSDDFGQLWPYANRENACEVIIQTELVLPGCLLVQEGGTITVTTEVIKRHARLVKSEGRISMIRSLLENRPII